MPNQLEANKAASTRFFLEIINQRKYEIAADIFHPEITISPSGHTGLQGVTDWAQSFHSGFSDAFDVVEDVVAEGNVVAVRITFTGTHDGIWLNQQPTHKRLKWSGIAIHTFKQGKIFHKFTAIDLTATFKQLGWLKLPT